MTRPKTLDQLRYAPATTAMSGVRRFPKPRERRTVNVSATLLPAHRDWLRSRPEGASEAIRRLIEGAMGKEFD